MKSDTTSYNIFQELIELSVEHRKLFDLLLEKQAGNLAQLKIPKRVPSDAIPLSYAQERIWSVAQLTLDLAVDNIVVGFQVHGKLNLKAFEESINLLIKRNEILRTNCTTNNQQVTQTIKSDFKPWIEIYNLSHLAKAERLKEVAERSQNIAKQPFNLSQDILLRVNIFYLDSEEFAIVLVSHQFATDGLSFRFLLQELATLYKAILLKEFSSLSEPSTQYADYAIWQRQWLTQASFESQITYWKQRLYGASTRLRLPSSKNCQHSAHSAASEKLELSATLSNRLRGICRERGVTPFMAFVALFQTLLQHYTQNNDISIGTLTSNRNHRQIEKLVGNFSNNLLLRTIFSKDLSFFDLLEKVRTATLEAYEHQDLPFHYLSSSVENLPQFQVLIILRNSTIAQNFHLHDLQVFDLPIELGLTRMDLSLDITDDGVNPIFGKFEYKADLFETYSIKKILQSFQKLLEKLIYEPDREIADFELTEITDISSQTSFEINKAFQEQNQLSKLLSHNTETKFVAPRTEVERKLAAIWSEILGKSQISISDNFFELGGHSLLAVKLFSEIEKRLNVNLPLSVLLRAPTISQLTDIIQHAEECISWSPLVKIQEGSSHNLPLYCMHGGGFNVLVYRSLALNLGPDQPVYGLQARGLDGKQQLHSRLENMAADYIREIQTVQPRGPYMLAGLSNGGNIALEMAQQLRAQGQSVILLALFDSYGPGAIQLLPPIPRFLSSLHYFLKYMLPTYILKVKGKPTVLLFELQESFRTIWKILKIREKELEQKKKLTFFSEMQMQKSNPTFSDPIELREPNYFENLLIQTSNYILRRSSWSFLTPSTQLQEMNDILSITLKDLEKFYNKIQINYNPQPYAGEINLFKASEIPPGYQIESKLGWGKIAKDGVNLYKIPGNHTSIMESKVLAKELRRCINKAVSNY